jgi:hypothetical protein
MPNFVGWGRVVTRGAEKPDATVRVGSGLMALDGSGDEP